MQENTNKNSLVNINFDAPNIPKATEVKGTNPDKPVSWGTNNKYPFFLIDELYGRSPIHSNIINQKATHIFGDGIYSRATNKALVLKPNADDTLELFIDKIVKDYLIFGAFAVEVNFSVIDNTITNYYHIPMQYVGLNASKDKIFFYGENKRDKINQVFDRYNPSIKYDNASSKVFYYEGYNPSNSSVYPQNDYTQLVKTILTDIAITDFNYNQITNHFSVSTMVNFFNGTPEEAIQREVIRDLRAAYGGESGKKILTSFNNPGAQPPQIDNLSAGDWHDAYIVLKEATEATIYKGHSITSPALFGDKTEGQLGSSQELENAYEIWNNSYLRVKRNELEAPLRELFGTDIYFQNKPLFSTSLSEEMKKSIMTINEIRKESGLAPIEGGDKIIGMASAPAPSASTFATHKCEHETGRVLGDEDYELVKDFGVSLEDFEELEGEQFSLQLKFDNDADILKHILDNGLTELSSSELRAEIKKSLGIDITTSGLKTLMTDLNKSGIAKVEVKDGQYIISPVPSSPVKVPEGKEVLVMFKYSKRPEVEGEEIISTSRGFCVKLCESGKLYSREDIQSMSSIFQYNIMEHTGGFYFNPKTGVTTPFCRHYWKMVSVVRKNKA